MTILLLFDHGCLAQRDRNFVSGLQASLLFILWCLYLYSSSMLLVSFGERGDRAKMFVQGDTMGTLEGERDIGMDPLGLHWIGMRAWEGT